MWCSVQAQAAGGKYSVLVEQRGLAGALLLESQVPPLHSSCKLFCNLQPMISYMHFLVTAQAILVLEEEEASKVRAGATKLCDGYCLLGNLRLSSGERVIHYLVLVTGAVSAGKLGKGEVRRNQLTFILPYSHIACCPGAV